MKDKNKRKEYEEKQTINLYNYYSSIGESFNYKVNQLSYLIGQNHFASVGSYKENLLRNEILKFLPSGYSIGTGFIAFPKYQEIEKGKVVLSTEPSKQLDIIIYDSRISAPIFKDNDFVVIPPECAVAVIEVKGFESQQIDPLEIYQDLLNKWEDYLKIANNLDISLRSPISVMELKAPCFCYYAFDTYVKKDGKFMDEDMFLKKIHKKIIEVLKDEQKKGAHDLQFLFPSYYKKLPWIIGAYIYKKLIVNIGREINGSSIRSINYVKLSEDEKDITFTSLIINLFNLCGIPFNGNLLNIAYTREEDLYYKSLKIYDVTEKEICEEINEI